MKKHKKFFEMYLEKKRLGKQGQQFLSGVKKINKKKKRKENFEMYLENKWLRKQGPRWCYIPHHKIYFGIAYWL